jgi:hypothetical protein
MKIKHIYQDIHGWFNFNRFYDSIIDSLPENFIFVEVGVWKGQSLSYFVVESINKNKKGKIFAIDHWLGSAEHQKNASAYDPIVDIPNKLYEQYNININSIRSYITDIRDNSKNASDKFFDNTIDAIFIDASHDYHNVLQDLTCWYPKVRTNGIFSGHDYNWQEVKSAVHDFAQANSLNIFNDGTIWKLSK